MNESLEAGRLLLVHEGSPSGVALERVLLAAGHRVERIARSHEALQHLERQSPEVILLDMGSDPDGRLDLLSRFRSLDESATCLVLARRPDVAVIVEAMKRGADHLLVVPIDDGELLANVDRLLDQHRLRRRTLVYQEMVQSRSKSASAGDVPSLVGSSAAMRRVRSLIRQVAQTDSSVVLLGETGTGKGMVARAIHQMSRRAVASFVEVNCATLPEPLVESEIFGHEKGAFTGAGSRKPGLLEVGDRGTVFLDEIADLDLQAQAKLLKCIEDLSFRRVGGVREISVNVRFVVATHRDLEEAVAWGRFREDLFYRLNVFQIRCPPLREREDIVELATHFVRTLNPVIGRKIERLSPRAAELLSSYSWPGNVRELRNVIERAMILASGNELLAKHLPQSLRGDTSSSTPLKSLADVEAGHIEKVLQATGFNILRAAKILGISRSTLYEKMRKLGLRPDPKGLHADTKEDSVRRSPLR